MDVRVRGHLAVLYQNLGQGEKAVVEYEKVLEIEPDNKTALNNLAWLYMLADNPDALALAERAYEADPENPGVLDTYGWIQVQQGRVKGGLRMLTQAMEQLSDIPEVRYHYAVALYKTGDRENALQIIEELLKDGRPFEGRDEARRILGS